MKPEIQKVLKISFGVWVFGFLFYYCFTGHFFSLGQVAFSTWLAVSYFIGYYIKKNSI
jgi:branched-subunit amino acid transport protein AzlD